MALERAYAKAGFSPATVGLIEAHGTGTVAGDQAEVETLKRVFGAAGATRQSCAIGSVKSMIGHTKCTAGVAGLMKIALALHHKVLPPTMHVEKPNPKARFPESPFYVNTEPRPWIDGLAEHPRRAGVSAFGFGGTNFHAVVEEYTGNFLGSACQAASQDWPGELLLWTGNSRQDLLAAIEPLEQALARGAKPALRDLAYTLWQLARERSELRLAVVATSLDDLRQKLAWAQEALRTPGRGIASTTPGGSTSPKSRWPGEGKVAFLFLRPGLPVPRYALRACQSISQRYASSLSWPTAYWRTDCRSGSVPTSFRRPVSAQRKRRAPAGPHPDQHRPAGPRRGQHGSLPPAAGAGGPTGHGRRPQLR